MPGHPFWPTSRTACTACVSLSIFCCFQIKTRTQIMKMCINFKQTCKNESFSGDDEEDEEETRWSLQAHLVRWVVCDWFSSFTFLLSQQIDKPRSCVNKVNSTLICEVRGWVHSVKLFSWNVLCRKKKAVSSLTSSMWYNRQCDIIFSLMCTKGLYGPAVCV